jgi:hypothetical protein
VRGTVDRLQHSNDTLVNDSVRLMLAFSVFFCRSLNGKKIYATLLQINVYSSLQFLSLISLSYVVSGRFLKTIIQKVSPNIKTVKDYKHINLQQDLDFQQDSGSTLSKILFFRY